MKQHTISRLLMIAFLGFMLVEAATTSAQTPTDTPQQELFTISGTVTLQGRTEHGEIDIYLTEAACHSTLAGSSKTQTNIMGGFELMVDSSQTYQCLYAQKTGFLMGRYSSPKGDIGSLTLLGGDVNGDNVINIFDLALIAGNYDSTDTAFDLNGDALVDIFDLTITAVNYNKRGPTQQANEL